MDNQEAIDELQYAIDLIKQDGWDWLDERDIPILETAIHALEKQIPKKPIRIDKNKEFDGNWKKVCPLCGRILIERITTPEKSFPLYHNYTSHCLCGQAINWEDLN